MPEAVAAWASRRQEAAIHAKAGFGMLGHHESRDMRRGIWATHTWHATCLVVFPARRAQKPPNVAMFGGLDQGSYRKAPNIREGPQRDRWAWRGRTRHRGAALSLARHGSAILIRPHHGGAANVRVRPEAAPRWRHSSATAPRWRRTAGARPHVTGKEPDQSDGGSTADGGTEVPDQWDKSVRVMGQAPRKRGPPRRLSDTGAPRPTHLQEAGCDATG